MAGRADRIGEAVRRQYADARNPSDILIKPLGYARREAQHREGPKHRAQ